MESTTHKAGTKALLDPEKIFVGGPWAPATPVVFDNRNYGAIVIPKYRPDPKETK